MRRRDKPGRRGRARKGEGAHYTVWCKWIKYAMKPSIVLGAIKETTRTTRTTRRNMQALETEHICHSRTKNRTTTRTRTTRRICRTRSRPREALGGGEVVEEQELLFYYYNNSTTTTTTITKCNYSSNNGNKAINESKRNNRVESNRIEFGTSERARESA